MPVWKIRFQDRPEREIELEKWMEVLQHHINTTNENLM